MRGGSTSSTVCSATTDTLESTAAPVEIFRKDYRPLPFSVESVQMNFQIYHRKTVVTTTMKLKPNLVSLSSGDKEDKTLVLDGDESSVKLMSLKQDGKDLIADVDYILSPGKLTILRPGNVIESVVEIIPEDNTQLSGLYQSGSLYCTQCEAMGFRRITYYPDRPDNMAVFDRVRIEADAVSCPVLLSNGNLLEEGTFQDPATDTTRKFAVWSDPFPKPSYLFAAVAGDLGRIQDTYITRPSGRKVQLQVFTEHNNVHKCFHAMESLKKAMKWDEDTFGLEYDLDLYNVVAVDSFNMGAMENKGLNIFNTAYVLADQKTATDPDFERVEAVIGHEYFHNWTGNRVSKLFLSRRCSLKVSCERL
jgi:aminopeptidase N